MKMAQKINKFSTEELAIGTVYKKLRLAKGFSQDEAAGSEISQTHLSNFENGKTIVSTHHFFKLLQNINVHTFEFQNVLNQYLQEKDVPSFNMDLSTALVEQDIAKLRRIVTDLNEHLNGNKASSTYKKLKLDYIRAKSTLSFLDSSYSISKEEISFVKNYLYNLKEWGQYDIDLLGQCSQVIDSIHLIDLAERMLSPFQANIALPYIKLSLIRTVLNIINTFVSSGIYEPARKFIKYLEESKIHDYYMFEKLTLIYNTAHFDFQKGNANALETMKQCQEILEFCNCSKTANWVASEIFDLEQKK